MLAMAKQAEVKCIDRGRHLDRLPVELLAHMFEFATENDWDNTSAIAISHVKRAWRALALKLPALWKHLSVPHLPIVEKVALILERSKQHPIKVCVGALRGIDADRIVDMVCAVNSRIVWLAYNHQTWTTPETQKRLELLDLPNVRYVSMTSDLLVQLSRNTPKLHHLDLPWKSITKALAPKTIYKELQLLKCGLEDITAVELLSACPNLRRASFNLSRFSAVPQEGPVTSLHFLEHLEVSESYPPRLPTMLTFLRLPKLRHLVIQLTQVIYFSAYESVHLPQLETLRLETSAYNPMAVTSRIESVYRIGILLIGMSNIHKLSLNNIFLSRDIIDMANRFQSGQHSQDGCESSPSFLPRLRILVLVNCAGLKPPRLKNLLLQWTTVDGGGAGPERRRTLRINGTEKLRKVLQDSWSGVVGTLTRSDEVNSAWPRDRWLNGDWNEDDDL